MTLALTLSEAKIDVTAHYGILGIKDDREKLVINYSRISAYAISTFESVTLGGCAVTLPVGGKVLGGKIVDISFVIKPKDGFCINPEALPEIQIDGLTDGLIDEKYIYFKDGQLHFETTCLYPISGVVDDVSLLSAYKLALTLTEGTNPAKVLLACYTKDGRFVASYPMTEKDGKYEAQTKENLYSFSWKVFFLKAEFSPQYAAELLNSRILPEVS